MALDTSSPMTTYGVQQRRRYQKKEHIPQILILITSMFPNLMSITIINPRLGPWIRNFGIERSSGSNLLEQVFQFFFLMAYNLNSYLFFLDYRRVCSLFGLTLLSLNH